MTARPLLAELLARGTDPQPGREEFGGSSPIGLVVILLFFVAVFFLMRSMNKHLRRVPPSFDPPEEKTAETADGESEPAAEPDTGSDERARPSD